MECEQCDQLWKSYEKTVFEHVRLSNQLRMAEASGDSSLFTSVARDTDAALTARTAARQMLIDHERAAGHGQSSSASGI